MDELRLYDYPASANCYKVRLLLAQLNLPYERVPVDIFAGETQTEEYRRLNPNRSTPVLELLGGERVIESAAILVYLAAGTALLPEDRMTMAEALRWMLFEQTEVVPAIGGLRFRLQTGRLDPADEDAVRRRRNGEAVLDLIEDHLSGREFLAGDGYTVADIAMFGYLHVAEEAGYTLSTRTALSEWLGRVRRQPRFLEDLTPYPANARPGAGRSIYD